MLTRSLRHWQKNSLVNDWSLNKETSMFFFFGSYHFKLLYFFGSEIYLYQCFMPTSLPNARSDITDTWEVGLPWRRWTQQSMIWRLMLKQMLNLSQLPKRRLMKNFLFNSKLHSLQFALFLTNFFTCSWSWLKIFGKKPWWVKYPFSFQQLYFQGIVLFLSSCFFVLIHRFMSKEKVVNCLYNAGNKRYCSHGRYQGKTLFSWIWHKRTITETWQHWKSNIDGEYSCFSNMRFWRSQTCSALELLVKVFEVSNWIVMST